MNQKERLQAMDAMRGELLSMTRQQLKDELQLNVRMGDWRSSLPKDALVKLVARKRVEKMEKENQKKAAEVKLETTDPDDEAFREYLRSNNIRFEILEYAASEPGAGDIVRYIGPREALSELIDEWFACGDDEVDAEMKASIKEN